MEKELYKKHTENTSQRFDSLKTWFEKNFSELAQQPSKLAEKCSEVESCITTIEASLERWKENPEGFDHWKIFEKKVADLEKEGLGLLQYTKPAIYQVLNTWINATDETFKNIDKDISYTQVTIAYYHAYKCIIAAMMAHGPKEESSKQREEGLLETAYGRVKKFREVLDARRQIPNEVQSDESMDTGVAPTESGDTLGNRLHPNHLRTRLDEYKKMFSKYAPVPLQTNPQGFTPQNPIEQHWKNVSGLTQDAESCKKAFFQAILTNDTDKKLHLEEYEQSVQELKRASEILIQELEIEGEILEFNSSEKAAHRQLNDCQLNDCRRLFSQHAPESLQTDPQGFTPQNPIEQHWKNVSGLIQDAKSCQNAFDRAIVAGDRNKMMLFNHYEQSVQELKRASEILIQELEIKGKILEFNSSEKATHSQLNDYRLNDCRKLFSQHAPELLQANPQGFTPQNPIEQHWKNVYELIQHAESCKDTFNRTIVAGNKNKIILFNHYEQSVQELKRESEILEVFHDPENKTHNQPLNDCWKLFSQHAPERLRTNPQGFTPQNPIEQHWKNVYELIRHAASCKDAFKRAMVTGDKNKIMLFNHYEQSVQELKREWRDVFGSR
jgi:hypothetical protein